MPSVVTRANVVCFLLLATEMGCMASASAPPAEALPTASSGASADSWVVGRVSHRADGKVISAANMTLYFQEIEQRQRKPLRSRTNREGTFELGPVSSGLYCLEVKSFGYHPVATEFTLRRGTRDTVDFVLDRSSARISLQRCLPDRASIDMCPVNADSLSQSRTRTNCSGHA